MLFLHHTNSYTSLHKSQTSEENLSADVRPVTTEDGPKILNFRYSSPNSTIQNFAMDFFPTRVTSKKETKKRTVLCCKATQYFTLEHPMSENNCRIPLPKRTTEGPVPQQPTSTKIHQLCLT